MGALKEGSRGRLSVALVFLLQCHLVENYIFAILTHQTLFYEECHRKLGGEFYRLLLQRQLSNYHCHHMARVSCQEQANVHSACLGWGGGGVCKRCG